MELRESREESEREESPTSKRREEIGSGVCESVWGRLDLAVESRCGDKVRKERGGGGDSPLGAN